MEIKSTDIEGVYTVDLNRMGDDRGFFARAFCHDEFVKAGLNPKVVQSNLSVSRMQGTLRGLHWQLAPKADAKLVRCLHGAIADVVIDMRENSKTYLQHMMIELSHENRRAVFIPEGVAHGFQTLLDDTEILYQVSEFYAPECEAGIRYNDPRFNINWPIPVTTISEKDTQWPDWQI